MDDVGKTSKYSGWLFQQQRLNKLQDTINECAINPFLVHPLTGNYNYEVSFACLNSLFSEMRGKLKQDELTRLTHLRDSITAYLDKHPIVRKKKTDYGDKEKTVVDESAWKVLRNVLTTYEQFIREYLDSHGLNSPDGDDDEGL